MSELVWDIFCKRQNLSCDIIGGAPGLEISGELRNFNYSEILVCVSEQKNFSPCSCTTQLLVSSPSQRGYYLGKRTPPGTVDTNN